ncbi:MAG: efflux RND transporter permease subunit, partial [Allomuricauda sp.]
KFNINLRNGLDFNEALYEAGRSRFRAIFLTSITTIAGLAPLLLEKSRQAQFLKPMAISIAYGIGFATVLTLLMLPLFLSFGNHVKVLAKRAWTGEKATREEVERAIKEQNEEQHMLDEGVHQLNGSEGNGELKEESSKVLEETIE